jgi:hypothetical protein
MNLFSRRSIKINGINVERVEKAMILGLLITQDMKWNAYVDKITTKAAKRLSDETTKEIGS